MKTVTLFKIDYPVISLQKQTVIETQNIRQTRKFILE